MRDGIFRVSVFLLLGFILTACTRPYSRPDLKPGNAEFPGLANFAKSRPDHAAVDVLSVHGMCTHGREWVTEAGHRFGEFLDLEYLEPEKPITEVSGIEIWLNQLRSDTGQVVVRNYALVWSGLTAVAKRSLCYDASVSTDSCPSTQFEGKRAKANSELKSVLLNDCLSDAIIYLGPEGEQIRESMRAAISEVGRQRENEPGPLILVTESLGSKIVADSIVRADAPADERARQEALQALRGTEIIFMAANQVPLLNLAYHGEVGLKPERPTIDQLRRALEDLDKTDQRLDFGLRAEPIYIVAFSDPNDLLSYELEIPEDRTTVNVRVSNSATWFGWLENPLNAHTGYLDNDKVWGLINCGNPSSC